MEKAKQRRKTWIILISCVVAWVGVVLLFRAPTYSMSKYRKTEDIVMATSLASSIENFYGEYNRLPDVGARWLETTSPEGVMLLEILSGVERQGEKVQNERSIIFLQGREAKGKKGGIAYGKNDEILGVYDPFGNPYRVILNSANKDTLDFEYGGQQVRLRGKQVAVWSVGGDGIEGTKDDARSWN